MKTKKDPLKRQKPKTRKKILQEIQKNDHIKEEKLKTGKTTGETYFEEEIQILKALNPQKYKHITRHNSTQDKTRKNILKELYEDRIQEKIKKRTSVNGKFRLWLKDYKKILEKLKQKRSGQNA